jgi:hypothetical protein
MRRAMVESTLMSQGDDQAGGVGAGLQSGHDALPDAGLLPAAERPVDRCQGP